MRISLNGIFNFAKDHLHEQGLRTGPAAPKPAECGAEHNNAGQKEQRRHREDDHVLWPKNLAQDREAPLDDVYEQEWISVNAHERAREQQKQQQPTYISAPPVEPAGDLLRIDPAAVAFLIGGGPMGGGKIPHDLPRDRLL